MKLPSTVRSKASEQLLKVFHSKPVGNTTEGRSLRGNCSKGVQAAGCPLTQGFNYKGKCLLADVTS